MMTFAIISIPVRVRIVYRSEYHHSMEDGSAGFKWKALKAWNYTFWFLSFFLLLHIKLKGMLGVGTVCLFFFKYSHRLYHDSLDFEFESTIKIIWCKQTPETRMCLFLYACFKKKKKSLSIIYCVFFTLAKEMCYLYMFWFWENHV